VNRTLFLIKPDAVRRRQELAILRRVVAAGFTLVAFARRNATYELARAHYAEHAGRPYFEPLVAALAGRPCYAGIVRPDDPADHAVVKLRRAIGPYSPRLPGTIRGDFMRDGEPTIYSRIHAADAVAAAAREIALWFPQLALREQVVRRIGDKPQILDDLIERLQEPAVAWEDLPA
jgi:nucleoside-diphosphate kinase